MKGGKVPIVSLEKWTTVGGKKGGKGGSGVKVSDKTTGLSHSKAAFSQYGTTHKFGEEEDSDSDKLPIVETIKDGPNSGISSATSNHLPHQTTKKAKPKKPKVKKQSFQECLVELQPDQVAEAMEEVSNKHEDNPMSKLMEVHEYLGQVFLKAEPEKDHVFSNELPGYPLCALPSESRDSLREVVSECPSLVKEKAFRRCVDILLGGLGAGTATYGTRVMILLLIQCDNSVCVETSNMIKLHLESSISKVPEALSLLWVGMPHPKLHPFAAVRTWPTLCLPLFQLSNIPKQVFNYAVDYTTSLLRQVRKQTGTVALEVLTPNVLIALITSPVLLNKRSQKSVEQLLELVQETVLEVASDGKLAKYFKASFKILSAENECSSQFTAGCLRKSKSSWEAWSTLGPSSPSSSLLVMKELALDVAPPPLPLDKLADVITRVSHKIPEKEREVAKGLLESYAEAYEAEGQPERVGVVKRKGPQQEEKARWCSVCGVLTLFLSLLYLCLLAVALYYIAVHGPSAALDHVSNYVTAQDVNVAWQYIASAISDFCFAVHQYVPEWFHDLFKLFQSLLKV